MIADSFSMIRICDQKQLLLLRHLLKHQTATKWCQADRTAICSEPFTVHPAVVVPKPLPWKIGLLAFLSCTICVSSFALLLIPILMITTSKSTLLFTLSGRFGVGHTPIFDQDELAFWDDDRRLNF